MLAPARSHAATRRVQERRLALLRLYRSGTRRPETLSDALRVGLRTIRRDMAALDEELRHILACEKAQLLSSLPPARTGGPE